ncbi:MAG TPA: tubulin-like doman-containing protein, partial [Gemmataceae bacterium]|nr:tubulin-like doman-containing protein [Gemmataceae bacterium]
THARRVREEIHASVNRTAQRCAQASAGKAGSVCPRIILVGSISGGTSGGAMIDLTYAIRGELKRRGLSDDQVHGMLLHATPRINAERDKARANAYATLREIDHFSRPGGHYPGEPHLSAPPFHGDNAVFSQAHFLNLGEGLGQLEWELATDQISEFIYSTTFSAAGRILDAQCAPEGDGSQSATLLPHEVLSLSTGTSPILVHAARIACADVLRLWGEGHAEKSLASGGTERTAIMNSFTMNAAPKLRQIEEAARHKLVELKLDVDRLLKDAVDALHREIGADTDRMLTRVVDETLNATAQEESAAVRIDLIFEFLDRYLQSESQSTSDQFSCDALYVQIEGRLTAHARSGIEPLMSWLNSLVDARDARIEGARQSAVAAQRQMQALQEGIVAQAAEFRESALAIALDVRSADNHKANQSRFSFGFRKKDPNDRLREMLKPYAQARIQEMLRRAAAKMGRIVVAEISTFIEQLDRLSRGLDQLPEPIRELACTPGDDELPSSTPPVLAAFRETMGTQLVLRREAIAHQIENQLDEKLFSADVRLSSFLSPEFELRRMLWRPLADAARETVLAAIRDIFRKIVSGNVPLYGGDLISLLSDEVRRESHAGRSPVAGRVLIVPDEVDPATVRDRLQSTLSNTAVVPGGKCDVTLWTVRRPTSAESVALTLIGGNPQYA